MLWRKWLIRALIITDLVKNMRMRELKIIQDEWMRDVFHISTLWIDRQIMFFINRNLETLNHHPERTTEACLISAMSNGRWQSKWTTKIVMTSLVRFPNDGNSCLSCLAAWSFQNHRVAEGCWRHVSLSDAHSPKDPLCNEVKKQVSYPAKSWHNILDTASLHWSVLL